jgi:hypothetical protein
MQRLNYFSGSSRELFPTFDYSSFFGPQALFRKLFTPLGRLGPAAQRGSSRRGMDQKVGNVGAPVTDEE